jgi:hypothetical protein
MVIVDEPLLRKEAAAILDPMATSLLSVKLARVTGPLTVTAGDNSKSSKWLRTRNGKGQVNQ